jgi:hypothetical protein
MNILSLKQLVASLPDDVTPLQFGAIEVEYEDLLAQQRAAEEAELAAAQARVRELQVKLGVDRSNALAAASVRAARGGGDTDFDAGLPDYDDETTAQSFRDEIANLRQRNVERRRGH